MPRIFISHTSSDKPLAKAIEDMLGSLYKGDIKVKYSTSDTDGGIEHGRDWYQWILEQVREADVSLVLLTPASVQKPWILWEIGAVGGVSIATAKGEGHGGEDRVRPLIYGLKSQEMPPPLRMTQSIRGDERDGAQKFFRDLMRTIPGGDAGWAVDAAQNLVTLMPKYLSGVQVHMRKAPFLVTEAAVQEWLGRLTAFEDRASEVHQLHRWIRIAFGRSDEGEDRPLDLRIHRRLAELYAKSGTPHDLKRVIRELELARQLAPRDVFVLRQLGVAYVDDSEFEKADEIVCFIRDLDEAAFQMDPDCAAFLGKRYRRDGLPSKAIEVYSEALSHNSSSYYLANLAAESSLEADDAEQAKQYYRQALNIAKGLRERNIWAAATALNASLALDDTDSAEFWARSVTAAKPFANQLAVVLSGVELLAVRGMVEEATLARVRSILKHGRDAGEQA